MSKYYFIEDNTLASLANALRSVTGETRSYTPVEMIEAVTNIMETGTYILVDEEGNELPAVFVENEMRFNATANDIRKGTVAVTDSGVTEGTKEIPAYHTEEGRRVVKPGESLDIPMYSDQCQYTKLQVIVCSYLNDADDSVSAEMVVVNDKLYAVGSTEILAEVSVDADNQTIKLGITNTSETSLIIRYMTIKEE